MPEVRTIVLKVSMHCEGCARKVRKGLCGLSGLEELKVDYGGQRVTVKGVLEENEVLKTLSRMGKSGEILQVVAEHKKQHEGTKEAATKEIPPPQVQTVFLKAILHCEGCGRKVKDAIKKVSGVQEVTVHFKEQMVIVKGFADANKVLQKALKTGKHVELCSMEKPKDLQKEKKGVSIEEKKDLFRREDKKEAPKGDGKDTSNEGKQGPKMDKKNNFNEKNAAEDKDAKDTLKNNTKGELKEASKDISREKNKDIHSKEEKKAAAPMEDKRKQKEDTSPSQKIEKQGNLKNEAKNAFKDANREDFKVLFEDAAPPNMVYRCDAPQYFSEDNPNACIII